jgi:hypothetical protein
MAPIHLVSLEPPKVRKNAKRNLGLSSNNLALLRKKAGLLKNKFLKKVAEMFGGFGYFL